MSAPRNPIGSGDWRELAQTAQACAPAFAIVMAVIAMPLALLYLTPLVLGLFAPKLDPRIDLYAVNRPVAFTFLDADGNDVGHRGAIVGERLALDKMPRYLPAAFIAMEDRRFYSHNGIDPLGLVARPAARSACAALGGGRLHHQPADRQDRLHQPAAHHVAQADRIDRCGGTGEITQQEADPASSISTASIWAAAPMAWTARPTSISALSARSLTLAQAAMLATLTRAPSVFSPRRDLLRAQQRASLVLDSMVDDRRDHPGAGR